MSGRGGNTQAKSTAQRKKAFLGVLESNTGSVTDACKAIGVSRNAYYGWIKNDEAFTEACKDITEGLIDHAESQMHKAIKEGQAWAICFFLKCKAKHRGYVERQELTGPSGSPVVFRVVYEEMKTGEADGS